jgi:2-amino-4-hydroxy-6-hydroxymethyldihydropteridine diphosphokinase
MAVVYLGIGSNLGDRKGNCLAALRRLEAKEIHIKKQSSMLETKPWGVTAQPDFINMAAEAETVLSPEDLLSVLKDTEIEMGREPGMRWGPRVIDLDILFYDDKIIRSEFLIIPHPFLHERAFVLEPLSEIAPDFVHPVVKKTIRELLANKELG